MVQKIEENIEKLNIPVESVHKDVAESVSARIWHSPADPRGIVILYPATATPQGFYAGFAKFFNTAGYTVVTFDYRGTCESGDPRDNAPLRMRDWMFEDVPAVNDFVRERFPEAKIFAVGHSIGGHAMVLGNGLKGVDRFVVVSAHVAHTGSIDALPERIRVALMLHVVGPGASRLLGYMPAKKFGVGEDMPKAAMIEWGGWAKRPGYFFDDPSMDGIARAAGVSQDVLAIGATDDPWATPKQMDALTNRLTRANVTRRTYSPADLNAKRIGHHGLLRRGVAEPAWQDILDWLER